VAAVSLDELFAFQARQCTEAGSPLYGTVLEAVRADIGAGGVCAGLLAAHERDPFGYVLPLRLLGAVHRIVLEGRAPELARCYPSMGGDPAAGDPGARFLDAVAEHREEVARRLHDGVQTNEVGRCAVLVGGFATVARRTGLPLRLLEMGASAGLNLRWDHYAYEPSMWEGQPPELPESFDIAERRGCDPSPIDPTTEEGRLRLRCFVWPDQVERRARLDAALEVASRVPALVERADGPDWVAARLAEPSEGTATVVYHSIVLQYLPRERRKVLRERIAAAGARATDAAPLHWLRMEPGGDVAELRLTSWPGGREELLATSGFHGPPVRWLVRG
jgi:hypothetical protein